MSAGRIALVGATSQVGEELKVQLARAGYPGSQVQLLDLDEQVGLVTDYGDEARVVLEAARESVATFRLACFCGQPEIARALAPAVADAGGIAVDCTGAFATGDHARLAGAGGDDDGPGIVSIPHPASLLLAALARAEDLQAAVTTLLLPASERDSPGTDAMARQATALLSFGEADDSEEDVFGRRVAFDVWPEQGDVAERIAGELRRLDVASPHLFLLRAPVFHSLSATTWLPGREVDAVAASLADAGVLVDARDRRSRSIDSPARAAGQIGLHATSLRADGDGVWLWAVLDNFHAIAAAALEVVAASLDPGG